MHYVFPVIPYMAYHSIMSNMHIQMYVYVVSILAPTHIITICYVTYEILMVWCACMYVILC